MRQLLWKEWHEQCLALLLWALAVVGTGVFAHAQALFGAQQINTYANWMVPTYWKLLPTALALLTGLGAYGSELTGERATFLYSRALSWKQVLLAKVLLGLTVVVGAPVLTAVILRLGAPASHQPFMTPAHLLPGILLVSLQTGVPFFIGLGCSIVLPGLAGSVLVLLGYIGIVFLVGITGLLHKDWTQGLVIGVFSAPLVAAMVIARFGITLSPSARVRRFTLVLVILIIAGSLLELIPHIQEFEENPFGNFENQGARSPSCFTNLIMSPSGAYAYAEWDRNASAKHAYWLDLAGKRCLRLPPDQSILAWTDNDCLFTWTSHRRTDAHGYIHVTTPDDCTLTWLKNGQLHSHRFTIGQACYTLASPDGTKILFLTERDIVVYDLQMDKMRSTPISLAGKHREIPRFWWQTADVFGYINPLTGQRVLVTLGKE